MKSIGIDFGMARIGIALSDETKFLATPYETYHRINEEQDLNHLAEIISTNKVDEVVACGEMAKYIASASVKCPKKTVLSSREESTK
ncbi:MAG: RuvX/YqgF family protein [Clostridia bacterium]|nr:RuvX/YqgF family protein [Clostridia bacterium]